jgi:hypothetical protein
VFCLAFDQIDVNYTLEPVVGEAQVVFTGGNSLGEDSHDPQSIYNRGLWFDGSDYVTITGLVLNTSFTTKFWVLAKTTGVIFSINRQ